MTASARYSSGHNSTPLIGVAELTRRAYQQGNLTAEWNTLARRLAVDPMDASAYMDMSVILQTLGQRETALEVQATALRICRSYRRVHGNGTGLRVLAFVTAGDLMANTPLDFMLEGSNVQLFMFYVDATTAYLPGLPEHDVAFMAIGESEANVAVLANVKRLLAGWKGPILNNAPERIAGLTRDGVAAMFENEPDVLAPPTVRASRASLQNIASGHGALADLLDGAHYPVICRPIGTHAGQGMEKINDSVSLGAYLGRYPATNYYLAPFVDYSGTDGLFRKQRIAFIDGRAYASHYAVSEHWMVHYLSAGMTESAPRRAEEAAWMENFDADFASRHATAFAALQRQIGLDYFAIDCAELPDGRLLLFEADVAMIVHDMDSETVFPYKKPAMRRLFSALQKSLQASLLPAA